MMSPHPPLTETGTGRLFITLSAWLGCPYAGRYTGPQPIPRTFCCMQVARLFRPTTWSSSKDPDRIVT
eukprot:9090124-Pyramimonas_sp.AAC.1